jgi:hypothetical protein
MATTIGENSRPALRPAGRNSNPLVANVFPPAFAIQKSCCKRRDKLLQDNFTELSRQGYWRDRETNPGPPGIETDSLPGALPCSPAGIPAAAKETGDKTTWRDMAAPMMRRPETGSFGRDRRWPVFYGANVCSLAGIRRFQIFSKINSFTDKRADKFLPRLYSLNVVPSGIRPAKNLFRGGRVSAGTCIPTAPPSMFTTSPARSNPPSDRRQAGLPQTRR